MSGNDSNDKNTERKTADIEILEYLTHDGPHTFGEIKEHLKRIGKEYANNKGLDKRLKILRDKGEIVREKRPGDSYPVYQVMANSDFAIKYDGYFLKDQISFNMENDRYGFNKDFDKFKKNTRYTNDEYGEFQQSCEDLIRFSIFRFGFQVLYSILVANRRVKNSQGWKDPRLELWLKSALSFEDAVPSARFSRQLFAQIDLRFSQKELPFAEKLLIIEKTLKKLCPESYDTASKAEEDIDSGVYDDIKKRYASGKGPRSV